MKPTPDLFNLIRSLKQTEKRYFKVYASKLSSGKDPEYIRLFNAMDRMEVYNENDIKEQFKGKSFVKQLHVAKNYLTDVILQSLAAYHHESPVNNKLLQMLQTIEILYNKELHDLCFKQIEKGIKLCRAYSKSDILFSFLSWKARIMQRRLNYAQVLQTIEEQRQITDNLAAYLNAKERAIKMHHFIVTKGFPRTEKEKEALKADNADLFRTGEDVKMSLEESYYHYITLGKYYAASGENKKRVEPLAELVALLEKNKNYALENPDIYISALGDYWLALINTGQIKPARSIFLRVRELAEKLDAKWQDAKNYAFIISYIFELDTSVYTNETHKTVQLAPRIMELVKKTEGVHQKSTTLELIYNTYRVLFIAGRYSEALDWVNLILNEQMGHIREDLNASAHILYVIIHYELGNTLLLRRIIASTRKSLKYKHRLFKAEEVVLQHLQKLNKIKNKYDRQSIFRQLSDSFNSIYNDPAERKSSVDWDIAAWINSKLSGQTIGEILAEKYRKEVSGF